MKKKILIVGGGFAGIQLTRRLDDNLFDILLVDKINHHQFQPLFYQVATSQLEPSSISFPLRHIFRKKKNVQIRLGELIRVDMANKKAHFDIGIFDYDSLVLAMGCKTNFFGNKNIEKHALTLKTTYDAISMRNHLMQTFENFLSANEDKKEGLLNLVIVGAGPTGVEMAGAFAELVGAFEDVDAVMERATAVGGAAEGMKADGEEFHDFFFFRSGLGNYFNSFTAASKSCSTREGRSSCGRWNFSNSSSAFCAACSWEIFPACWRISRPPKRRKSSSRASQSCIYMGWRLSACTSANSR